MKRIVSTWRPYSHLHKSSTTIQLFFLENSNNLRTVKWITWMGLDLTIQRSLMLHFYHLVRSFLVLEMQRKMKQFPPHLKPLRLIRSRVQHHSAPTREHSKAEFIWTYVTVWMRCCSATCCQKFSLALLMTAAVFVFSHASGAAPGTPTSDCQSNPPRWSKLSISENIGWSVIHFFPRRLWFQQRDLETTAVHLLLPAVESFTHSEKLKS